MDNAKPTREQLEQELSVLRDQLKELQRERGSVTLPDGEHQALLTPDDKFAKAFHASPDSVIISTLTDGRILEVNEGFESISEYSRDEAVGKTSAELNLWTIVENREKLTIALRANKPVRDIEMNFLRKSGDQFTGLVSMQNFDLDGEPCIVSVVRDITEQKLAVEALRQSREQLQALTDHSSIAISWANMQGDILYSNKKFRDTYGYTLEDMPTVAHWLELAYPDPEYREILVGKWNLAIARAAKDNGEIKPIEANIVCKDGSIRYVEVSGAILPDRILAVFNDLTERKRAEEELRNEKEFTETALNSQQDTFFLFEPDTGKAIRWNRAFNNVTGYSDEEISAMAAPESYYSPEDLQRASILTKKVLKTGLGTIELYLICKDGSTVPTEYNVSVIKDAEGKAKYFISIGRDVTERKRAEEALRASEANYRTLVSHTPAVLWTTDQNGHTSFISSNVEQVYGYTAREIIASGDNLWFGRIHSEDMASVKAAYAAMIERGKPFDIEYRIQRQDGNWIWLHDRGTRNYEIDGMLRVDGVFLDVTERKQAEEERDHLEEQLRQSQKMEAIGELAGGIAHDFNNILTAILGNAELLKMSLPADGEQAKCAEEVFKSANRATELTGQLLAFARKGKRQVTHVDIHNVATQTVDMLSRSIDRRIDIRLELNASPCTIMGDPMQLQNAMLNLGVNARDAMADGGVLTYATRNVTLSEADCDKHPCELTPGDFMEINVTDTGAGIDEQTQKRIFEPFFTTKDVGKGTGLGLAGVYGCVRNHDGSISVSSEPGQGATFTILLPLADTDAASAPQTVPSNKPVRGTGHVLIVDDEENVRNLVRMALQSLGYTVSACSDGAEGVDYYRDHRQEIDLVILDLIMPKMSGHDAFEEMKKINPNVRVLISSGFSHTQATRQMMNEGALALLNKPFQIADLSEAVALHIQQDSP
jgi:two-component system, cell cycle sensor histidine kinase and response regulator CckA